MTLCSLLSVKAIKKKTTAGSSEPVVEAGPSQEDVVANPDIPDEPAF
jgi:hypothetical protein